MRAYVVQNEGCAAGYAALRPVLEKRLLRRTDRILMAGAGNSRLGEEMGDALSREVSPMPIYVYTCRPRSRRCK